MELVLTRTYYNKGTNGSLTKDGVFICHTIELPWKDNLHGASCIPEGRYELAKRYSPKFQWHLILKHVPDRDLILIHAANDALKELRGCIAPVTTITGVGKGDSSRVMLERLKTLVYPALTRNEKVFIKIGTLEGDGAKQVREYSAREGN